MKALKPFLFRPPLVYNRPRGVGREIDEHVSTLEKGLGEAFTPEVKEAWIAIHLGIAERTVKAHLDSVYNKLGIDSRAAAVAIAIERGLLGSPAQGEE